jgi:hypothetical protein
MSEFGQAKISGAGAWDWNDAMGEPGRSRRSFVLWPKRWKAYILFLAQVLVVSSHVPPAIMQSDSVFASFASPAKAEPVKAGPVKTIARVKAKIERRVFMGVHSPTLDLKSGR